MMRALPAGSSSGRLLQLHATTPRPSSVHHPTGRVLGLCFVLQAAEWRPRRCGSRGCRPLPETVSRAVKRERAAVCLEIAEDTRAALYRVPEHRDLAECHRQEDLLRARALADTEQPHSAEPSCNVCVHYSWDCLRRLQSALEVGKKIAVGSVLVPKGTPDALLSLALDVSPETYMASKELIQSEFSPEGSRKGFCQCVVAFPVSRALVAMQPPFIVLNNVACSHTIGQILRTAYHFGLDAVVLSRSDWEHMDGRACRVAMGWAYHMDFHLVESMTESLSQLRDLGVELYAAEPSSPVPVAPHQPPGNKKWALVIGSESSGLSPGVAELCHSLISVPLRRNGAMNIAHTAAICLYELHGLCSV